METESESARKPEVCIEKIIGDVIETGDDAVEKPKLPEEEPGAVCSICKQ